MPVMSATSMTLIMMQCASSPRKLAHAGNGVARTRLRMALVFRQRHGASLEPVSVQVNVTDPATAVPLEVASGRDVLLATKLHVPGRESCPASAGGTAE